MLVQLQRLEEKFSPELERRDTTTVATVEAEPIIPFGPELAGPTFATSALRLFSLLLYSVVRGGQLRDSKPKVSAILSRGFNGAQT